MKFMKWMEDVLMPKMAKFVAQKHIYAIRTGILASLPLTLVGSLFLVVFFLPIPGWTGKVVAAFGSGSIFLAPFSLTMGIIGVFITISIAHRLAEQYEVDYTGAGNMALVIYIMSLMAPSIKDGTAQGKLILRSMGATSIFGGIICAIFAVEILRICIQKNIRIKMPSGVPDAIADSFNVVVPLLIAVIPAWLLIITGFDMHSIIATALSPLKNFVVGSNFFGLMLIIFMISFLWSFGIHGASIILSLLVNPFSLQALTENANAAAAGTEIPNIVTGTFIHTFVMVGGSGATLGLLIAMFIFGVKSVQLKQIRKIAILPGLFQINEPVIFGFPIVMNPIMMIPFMLAPMASGAIAFFATKLGMIGKVFIKPPWTTPSILNAFFATTDWKAMVVSFICIVATVAIYAPFLKIYDKMLVNQELAGNNKK